MEQSSLNELRERRRRQLLRLIEATDLTRELTQAANRNDQVSVKMLLSMRREPLLALSEMEDGLRAYVLQLPQEDAIRASELLQGSEPRSEAERPLAEQVALYQRHLAAAQELDRQLSLRLSGKHSFYKKFREK